MNSFQPIAGGEPARHAARRAIWSRATNVLCVRLDNMGDVLMCTPAMRALAQARPDRRLTLLASPSGAALASFIPELDAVLAYRAPWVKAGAMGNSNVDADAGVVRGASVSAADGASAADADGAARLLDMAGRLRDGCFDAAVIFTSFSQSALPAALLCHLAGIPLRLAHCRENPYDMLTDWVPDPEPGGGIRHEVLRQLALVAGIGCQPDSQRLSFTPREADLGWMRARLQLAGIGLRPWVLMHPGATAPSRRYPAAHWSRVIRLLAAEGTSVVLTGDDGEVALIEAIVEVAGVSAPLVLSLAGELDLGRLGAAIALAPALVSNNTGPAHMAAALGTPLVDLYALTNPQHTPWQVESRVLFHDVPCRYCYKSICPQGHHGCLAGVTPAEVVDALRDLMQDRAAPNGNTQAAGACGSAP